MKRSKGRMAARLQVLLLGTVTGGERNGLVLVQMVRFDHVGADVRLLIMRDRYCEHLGNSLVNRTINDVNGNCTTSVRWLSFLDKFYPHTLQSGWVGLILATASLQRLVLHAISHRLIFYAPISLCSRFTSEHRRL